METYQISNPANMLKMMVMVSTNHNAGTDVFLKIGNNLVKNPVAQSEVHEFGCIDLDASRNPLWKEIGLAYIFQNNSLYCVTTIYDVPETLEGQDVIDYILENVSIRYTLNESQAQGYDLDASDTIILARIKTVLIIKEIQIV